MKDQRIERGRAVLGAVLCVLALTACQSATPVPGPEPSPTAAPVGTARSTAAPLPTSRFAPTPGPPLPPLPDAEAEALMREAALRYGAMPESVRVSIAGDPKSVTVRFASAHKTTQGPFELQRVLSTMAVARIAARTVPLPMGGVRVALIPAEDGGVGLLVTLVDGQDLARWAAGQVNDQQFVSQWKLVKATRE